MYNKVLKLKSEKFILYKKGRILMNHNRNAHYWENRDERKERAYLHTKNMAYVLFEIQNYMMIQIHLMN